MERYLGGRKLRTKFLRSEPLADSLKSDDKKGQSHFNCN
jgi:hypothetical protein